MFKNCKSILFGALIISSAALYAQPGGGGKPCPRPPCPQVPITGVEYLIGIGGLYGVKKLIDRSKNKDKRK